jgi:geranylgeranyl pyrophosphate synthase
MPPVSVRRRALRVSTFLSDPVLSRPPPPICAQCLFRISFEQRQRPRHGPIHSNGGRFQSAWASAVSAVQNTFSHVLPTRTPLDHITVDPLRIVGKELKFLNKNIRQLLGSGHPILDTVAKYYTQGEGKHVRPLLVLLMSRATANAPKQIRSNVGSIGQSNINTPISSPGILQDANPDRLDSTPLSSSNEADYAFPDDPSILPSQRRLAEITELIHTASLLHDDVIDLSTMRRSQPSANTCFGNKMAVLAGDFLLGRSSVALARLRDSEVTELLATVIANLVEGEFMQLKNTALDEANPQWSEDTITYYLQKTYLKSASLISKSCRAAALLGNSAPEIVEAAYFYGRNLGLAFQLVDDMLDYTISGTELGKPAGADLELGLATAPLLFAWETRPELGRLVGRKFSAEGDVQMVETALVQIFWHVLTVFSGPRDRQAERRIEADSSPSTRLCRPGYICDRLLSRRRGQRRSGGNVCQSDATKEMISSIHGFGCVSCRAKLAERR